jgi:hypothetical protein
LEATWQTRKRIDPMLAALRTVWQRHPELRLGQIIVNAASLGATPDAPVFYVNDEKMTAGLEKLAEL